jgi:hypothetical protein
LIAETDGGGTHVDPSSGPRPATDRTCGGCQVSPNLVMLVTSQSMSHVTSLRSLHSRPTRPWMRSISPGHSVLTASFATRGSRVQIPSAPLNTLVRAISARALARHLYNSVIRGSTGDPQDSRREAPLFLRGALSLHLTSDHMDGMRSSEGRKCRSIGLSSWALRPKAT